MSSDIKVSYDGALLKRQQLETEIRTGATTTSMVHTLEKLWIFVGQLKDAADRAEARAVRAAKERDEFASNPFFED